jgi:cation diffusion facilitator CzcD-associated flavoprotein CzcO
MGKRTETNVLIIGTGFSGLGMAIQLRRSGREDFLLLEKADSVGGTWRDNTYPGCACDIQSHMYSFSYEQNPSWSRSFSPQPEIREYLERVTDKYSLRERIHFGAEMVGARWHERERRWEVTMANGDVYVAPVVVSGVGALHVPRIPEIPGLSGFKGKVFHSADWDHDYDLRGKRVAVIGTGASSVQFVPQIAQEVDQLHVFQRTPPWIMPKPDHEMPGFAKRLFAKVPAAQRAYRNAIYWLLESRALGFNGHPAMMKAGEAMAKRQINKQIKDPALREQMTPDYRMGCKRVLISNDYYPAFNRENVQLVTDGVREVKPNAVVAEDGTEREVDAIIMGTGFHVTDGFAHLRIVGRDSADLATQFAEQGMQTYLGINVSGFPNLFFLLGPNTGLGHNSVVFMIEQQAKYVVRALDEMNDVGAEAMDVRGRAQTSFNGEIQRKLANGVWSTGGCTSWYLDAAGVNRTVWPGFTWRYWMRTKRVRLADYELLARRDVRAGWAEPAGDAELSAVGGS